jgi:hypothetical protein
MRIGDAILSSLSAVAAMGCANADFGRRSEEAVTIRGQARRIVVGPHSNVCVSVRVDERTWGQAFDAETFRNISGVLSSELELLHQAGGGSYSMPDSTSARFVADASGTNPECGQHGVDVFVALHYRPRFDGGPFVVEYRIHRGSASRSGTVNIDVAEEMRAGRMQGYSPRRTIRIVVAEDIRARARQVIAVLHFSR